MSQIPVLGIDLGTTNSLVACFDVFGNPKVLRDPKTRSPLLRSVVAFSTEGIVDVGEEAVLLSEEDPALVVYSVKRLMGVAPQDVSSDLTRFAQAVVADDKVVRLSVLGREYSAPEISAAILKRLKQRAEDYLETTVTQTVITVPAYFDDAQRQATKDAARLAGLEVMRLVNEPTAAALAYGLNTKKQGLVAVYDLGGGTFDISILKLEDGIFEVLSTAGETHLGGDDFDMRLAEKVLEHQGVALTEKKDRFRARRAGEACKKLLSDTEEAPFSLTLDDGRSFSASVTRAQFEVWCQDLLTRTGERCQQALADAKISASSLAAVVLVGGSTRMPMIRGYVERIFGQAPRTDVDPDEVVALGAAVQANILAGGEQTVLLLDVTPLSLGIETVGGVVANLIPRNSTIPISAQNVFTTHIDGQTSVNIHVLQGERDLARDCRSLARFTLSGIPPMPAAIPRIEVTFQLDADGLLQVTAREERSGVEAKVEVKPSYGLSEDEIESMLIASFDHAEEDVSQRMLVEARIEAESILSATEKSIAEDGDLLLSREELTEIENKLGLLKKAMQGTEAEAIRQAVSALDAGTQEYAQRRMNRAIQIALGGKDIAELGGTLELSIPVQTRRGH